VSISAGRAHIYPDFRDLSLIFIDLGTLIRAFPLIFADGLVGRAEAAFGRAAEPHCLSSSWSLLVTAETQR
jgi:hypothetical protein